jgi:MFS transporter, DHA1 family, staphyloferrin A biosynthesis exporter
VKGAVAGQESLLSRTFVSLGYRDFRLVWLGSVTEHLGEWMELAALLWLVNDLTHSPLMLTVVGSCRFIPMVFFPVLGGMVADRMDRRRLLIGALLMAAVLSIILAVLVKTGTVAVWHIIILSLLGGVATSFNHPARQSMVPNLVKREHLLNAISLDSASVQASRFMATPIAGYLIAGFGVVPVFGARAVGNLLALGWLMFVKTELQPPAAANKTGFRNVIDGLKYVRGDMLLLSLIPLYLIPWIAQNTSNNFLPIFARDILKIGASGYGFLQAAPGLGALASLIALAAMPFYRVNGSLLLATGGILGIALFLFAVSVWPILSLILLLLTGGMITTFMTVNTALIQSHVSDVMRGRVMSLREVANGVGPAGSLLFGAIAERSSAPFALELLGIACVAVSLFLAFFLSRVRITHV